MRSLRLWQSISFLLAGLCLWIGLSRQGAVLSPEDRPLRGSVERRSADKGLANDIAPTGKMPAHQAGMSREHVLPDVVPIPIELAQRLSDKLGSLLFGVPPAPMAWNQDQLHLLGFTESQIDALNAAAARMGAAALAEMKRVIRPMKPGEHSNFPEMEDRRPHGDEWQRFLIPNWHSIRFGGLNALREEVIAIAGRQAVDRLLPASTLHWTFIQPCDRILSVRDDPATGCTIADETVSETSSALTHLHPGRLLGPEWKALFQVVTPPPQ